MKPEEFGKSFEFILDALLRWVACLRGPAALSRSILTIAADPTDAFKRTISIWITAVLLSIIVRGWAYQFHGLGLTNMAFHLTSTLLLLAILVCFVLAIQLAFRIYRLPISFTENFVVYTVHISALAPFIALLYSPQVAHATGILKRLKADGVGLDQVLQRYFDAQYAHQDSALALTAMFISVMTLPLFSLQFSLVFSLLAERSGAARVAVFQAGALGIVLGALPTTLFTVMNLLIVYSYL